jgi:hypothetical protein
VPRNIASITLFAAAAAATTGALPRTALALCSGNACSAVTATATYDASNRKIIYILKNKDQATLHIRYSVNADGHSVNVSSMDTDIGPLETVTRNLPFNDAALKKTYLAQRPNTKLTYATQISRAARPPLRLAARRRWTRYLESLLTSRPRNPSMDEW